MTPRPLIALAAGLLAAVAPFGAPDAGREAVARLEPGAFAGIYDLHVGGIFGGEMAITARLDGGEYRAEASGRTAGIVAAVFDAGFAAVTRGRRGAAGFVPDRFEADAYSPGKTQKVAMRYEDGAPAEVAAEPPFDPKPWEVDPLAQSGAFDPLSAALSGLALLPREALCNRTVEVFDGRRRYAIDLGEPVADRESIRCAAEYRRVAGFKPKLMARPAWPFELWFEEGAGGLWHVSRAMGEMPLGIAAMNLRRE